MKKILLFLTVLTFGTLSLSAQDDINMAFVAPTNVSCQENAEVCWDIELSIPSGVEALQSYEVRLFFDEADLSYSSFMEAAGFALTSSFIDNDGNGEPTSSPTDGVDLGMDEEIYLQYNVERDLGNFIDPVFTVSNTPAVVATICFTIDTDITSSSEACLSLAWDKDRDDPTASVDGINEGVTATTNLGPKTEIVDHYNWNYITNNTGNEDTSDGCIETDCELGSISGSVTEDTDPTPDGIGDSPLIGVTIELLMENGMPVIGTDGNPVTTTTDDMGNYTFENVPPGNYQVREQDPAGYFSAGDSDGGDPNVIGNGTPITVVADMDSGNNDFIDRQNALPVEFISFNVTKDGAIAKLNWATATEINNSHYDVQRSTDGNSFETIGKVDGAGNASTVRNYAFTDIQPKQGDNFYRLQQVDYDGSVMFSKVRKVNFDRVNTLSGSQNVEMSYFPNPVSAVLNVNRISGAFNEESAEYIVYDMIGIEVMRINYNRSNQINVEDLIPGIYNINLMDGEGVLLNSSQIVKID